MKSEKDDYIRLLIDSKIKSEFKKLAKEKNTNMSEMIKQYIKNELEKSDYNKKNQMIIEQKSIAMEKKIQELKNRMEQKDKNKKLIFKIFQKGNREK